MNETELENRIKIIEEKLGIKYEDPIKKWWRETKKCECKEPRSLGFMSAVPLCYECGGNWFW